MKRDKFLLTIIIGSIVALVYYWLYSDYEHNKKYKCIRGHNDWYMQYIYDGSGNIISCYPVDYFVCDEEVLRDTTNSSNNP